MNSPESESRCVFESYAPRSHPRVQVRLQHMQRVFIQAEFEKVTKSELVIGEYITPRETFPCAHPAVNGNGLTWSECDFHVFLLFLDDLKYPLKSLVAMYIFLGCFWMP